MRYITETIFPSGELMTIYHRNFSGAKEHAQFLKDEYGVETEISSEHDYMELHPEEFDFSGDKLPERFIEPDFE